VPYLVDCFNKRVKPHPFTWLVWVIVSTIVLFGQVTKGAGIGALPAAVAWVFTFLIFIFATRYGFKYVRRADVYFLAVALLGIIPWIINDDPTISVVIAVAIDLVAFVPTLTKTYRHPETETPILYGSNVLRHVLTLFSLQAYNVATTLHSVSMIITNTAMVLIITRRKKLPAQHQQPDNS